MKRMMLCTTFFSLTALLTVAMPVESGDSPTAKQALQELNDFIGGWKGNGTSEKDKSAIWKENLDWSWRFKGKDVWLSINFSDSKLFKTGEMRYLTDKGVYELTLVDKADKKLVFNGALKKNKLTLERLDPEKKDGQQVVMNTAGGGVRFIWSYNVKPANRTQYTKEFQIALTKEGESFGSGADKKPVCVVTGGLGTSTVMHKGVTYYVCCSGCRDAFNENPEKIIKEYLDSKKKK